MRYYAKFESPDGAYVDVVGTRFDVSSARRVRDRRGVNEGYTPFPSLETALQRWELQRV